MSWNDRATYARATAIILYDFCQALGIPITVYGHSTSRGVDLYSYAEFDAIDRDDRYRMMDISARGSNRDGAALRFVAERLVHRPEDIKLLMLVSEPATAAPRRRRTCAGSSMSTSARGSCLSLRPSAPIRRTLSAFMVTPFWTSPILQNCRSNWPASSSVLFATN